MIGMMVLVQYETKSDGMIGGGYDRSATKDEHCPQVDRDELG